MQNILESISKTSSMRVLFSRFFLATAILLLSHTPGLALDSGASAATSYSPMTKKERWGPIFAPLAHPWETRLRVSRRNGAERLNATL